MITKLSQLDPNGTYSYADYLTWQFQERVELIRGKIFKMSPAPSNDHQKVSIVISGIIWQFFRNDKFEVRTAPFDVRLNRKKQDDQNAKTVVQPDICIICDPNKLDKRGCNGAPDLVVEILSPGNSRKEMHEKYEVYEENGVREYWLVNPLEKNVIIYLLNGEGVFVGQKPFVEDDQLSSFIFPELTMDLKEVFA